MTRIFAAGVVVVIAFAVLLAGFLVGVHAAERDAEHRENDLRRRLWAAHEQRDAARDTAVHLENELASRDEGEGPFP